MIHPHEKARFLWVGNALSPIEQLSLVSFLNFSWSVELFCYGPIANVPHGITIRDANEIIPSPSIFRDANQHDGLGSYTNFSDIFRWTLLSQQPGWWFDLDMVAISPPNSSDKFRELYFASTWEHEYGQCASNCAMYTSGSNEFIDEASRRARLILEQKSQREFCDLGPFLLQAMIKERGYNNYVAPWWEFCPFPWRQIKTSCSATLQEYMLNEARVIKHIVQSWTGHTIRPARIHDDTRAVHLHNEIWRLGGIAKGGPFYRHSFVGSQIKKYNISGALVQ